LESADIKGMPPLSEGDRKARNGVGSPVDGSGWSCPMSPNASFVRVFTGVS
jgi:hypothetical protein